MSFIHDQQLQKKLYQHIAKQPGIHAQALAEFFGVQIESVERQLLSLQRSGKIKVEEQGGLRRYDVQRSTDPSREARTEETRQKIYDCIAANPGLHLAKIADVLAMSIQLVNYHVLKMQKTKEIIGVQDEHGYYTRYYVAESGISAHDKRMLEMLRKPIPAEIVLLLLKHGTLQHKELRKRLHLYSSKLTYHLNNLLRYDIVEVAPHGEDKGYSLRDKTTIQRLLKQYNFSLEADIAIEEFKDIWDDLQYE